MQCRLERFSKHRFARVYNAIYQPMLETKRFLLTIPIINESAPRIFTSLLPSNLCRKLENYELKYLNRTSGCFSNITTPSMYLLPFTLVIIPLLSVYSSSPSIPVLRNRTGANKARAQKARPHQSCEPLCHAGINSA